MNLTPKLVYLGVSFGSGSAAHRRFLGVRFREFFESRTGATISIMRSELVVHMLLALTAFDRYSEKSKLIFYVC